MNKQKVEKVLDKIRSLVPELMELSFGCRVRSYATDLICKYAGQQNTANGSYSYMNYMGTIQRQLEDNFENRILGHSIYFRHVLGMIEVCKIKHDCQVNRDRKIARAINLWRECGVLKSLDEIVEESGFECKRCGDISPAICEGEQHLSCNNARELFNFLNQVFND